MKKVIPFHRPEQDNEPLWDETVLTDDDPFADEPPEGTEPPDEDEPDLSEMGLRELILSMPDGLLIAVLKRVLGAVLVLVGSLALLICFRMPQSALGFLLFGWLAWNALSIVFDYQSGHIIERVLVCSSVEKLVGQNRIRVVLSNNDVDCPYYYEYYLPGRKTKDFSPHMVYATYVQKSKPQLLLGWKKI